MNTVETLINELRHNAKVAQKPLEQRLADVCQWYFYHKGSIPRDNLASRQEFLEKTVSCLLEIAALQAERLHELEMNRAGASLWLPRGVTIDGDPRSFG